MKKTLIILLTLFSVTSAYSQITQGEWRDHLPYYQGKRVAITPDRVYFSASSGLLIYDKSTDILTKFSKVDGLSDIDINTIEYAEDKDKLLIGYINGNLDIMDLEGNIQNISDIKRKSITGSKSINRIFLRQNNAYLACDFGIVVIDIDKVEVKDSYFFSEMGTSLKVNDMTIKNSTIYAATDEGIYTASLNSPNLVDYNYWSRLTYIPQYTEEYKSVETFNNNIYAVYKDAGTASDMIIAILDDNYTPAAFQYDTVIHDLSSYNGYLCISGNTQQYIYDQDNQLARNFLSYATYHMQVDDNMMVFLASMNSGFNIMNTSNERRWLNINAPRFKEVNKISTYSDNVWVSSGGPNRLYMSGAAYSFIAENWTSFTTVEIVTNPILGNVHKIAIDPRENSHVYGGTYGYGLIEFRNGEVEKIYNTDNQELFAEIPSNIGVRVVGIQFDKKNNLWFLLDLYDQPLYKINADGTWEHPVVKSGIITSGGITYRDIVVTSTGDIWIITSKNGIVALREDGNGSFVEKTIPTVNQDGLTITRSFCAKEDIEGSIWVGTNNGPLIYYSPSRIFDPGNINGTQLILPRNDGTNVGDYLLSGEIILDIAVDGGNRKWFGTENSGVFLVSEDGKNTLFNFREDNSPLISNNVSGIGINEKDGEVFFATSNGLISYKGTATKGFEDFTDVFVYPNPIRPEYEGNITITGLVENTIVKITDISGNLVYENTSLGGQAIWDGRNFNGRRVATGVYLVFLSSENGSKTHITKLLFIH